MMHSSMSLLSLPAILVVLTITAFLGDGLHAALDPGQRVEST